MSVGVDVRVNVGEGVSLGAMVAVAVKDAVCVGFSAVPVGMIVAVGAGGGFSQMPKLAVRF